MMLLFCNATLGDRDKCRMVRSIVKGSKPDVVCLQETKLQMIDADFCCSLGADLDEFAFKESAGVLGGLLTVWNGSLFVCTNRVVFTFGLFVALHILVEDV